MPVAPPELIAESRKSEGRDPWIFLFEIQLDQASAVRIARNNEDVVFASETYEGWNLETTGFTVSDEQDEAADATIKVRNAAGQLKALLETYNDFVDCDVIVRIAHGKYLAEGYTLGEPQRWQIYDADVGPLDIEWKLGLIGMYEADLPSKKYSRNQCGHDFGNPDGPCVWPIDRYTENELQGDFQINPRAFKCCDLGYDSANGCIAHAKLAAALGIEPNIWPEIFGGQRGIKAVRQ
jgi:hypothetical protein